MAKKLPLHIMHEPKSMVWAEATPLSEHKKREAEGIQAELVPIGSKEAPLPLSRATTDLRKAYPYIFDCAAYAKTHNPEKIDTDLFYSRFTMPYSVFLDYCLDYCTEQTDYLKKEIYQLIKGQPAKYIKISQERTVLAQPVIIAFSHTDLKTGKEKRIKNIGHDAKVDTVQVQILKELLDVSHGYVNLPKAFYAKMRRAYNTIRSVAHDVLDNNGYWETINAVKSIVPTKITTTDAAMITTVLQSQAVQLDSLEQGGYHSVYLAFEYILANRKRGASEQNYRFLDLCEKCAPTLTQVKNGKRYFKSAADAMAFMGTLQMFALQFSGEKSIGIQSIATHSTAERFEITVIFSQPKIQPQVRRKAIKRSS
ncbi:MAG: hypothetical protein FWD94_02830 [Treponema sp.]|nr:hypothetical protein [Treponema sp.]